MRCYNCSGKSQTRRKQIDFTSVPTRIESLRETLKYLDIRLIPLKGCLAQGCPSERCSLDTHDEHGHIQEIFQIALIEMNRLKTLRIAFYRERYPDAVHFPSVLQEIKDSRRYSSEIKQSNLGKFVSVTALRNTLSVRPVEGSKLVLESCLFDGVLLLYNESRDTVSVG